MTVCNFSTQYNTEQFLPSDNHHSSDAVYWRGGEDMEISQQQLVLNCCCQILPGYPSIVHHQLP